LPLAGVSLGYILIKKEISFVFRGESFGTQVLGQRARRSGNQIRFKGNKKYSLPQSVQATFGPHPASNQTVEVLFIGGKAAGEWS